MVKKPLHRQPDYAARESAYLAAYAMHSADTEGREHAEQEHPYRGPFQRDRDRILHSAAFRRLSGKTQVFTNSMGDYHRTRLTHTMEVASIARTIGRTLLLNEDLIEAMAMLHDIGHPPFGHAGEDTLNECLEDDGGFSHNRFALTLVRELERPYPMFPGLNLSREVLDAQVGRAAKHSGGQHPLLEAQVVDIADSITYDAHDVDDAVKLQLLSIEQLREVPLINECLDRIDAKFGSLRGKALRKTLAHELIDCQVGNVLAYSQASIDAHQYPNASSAQQGDLTVNTDATMTAKKQELETFLYHRVYRHEQVVEGRRKVQRQLLDVFQLLVSDPNLLPAKFAERRQQTGTRRAAADYLAGMTDHFFSHQHELLTQS